jgi:hypothetical protein
MGPRSRGVEFAVCLVAAGALAILVVALIRRTII